MPRPKKSAGANETTKAELIRQAAKKIGKKVRPRDVIAALKEQGVVVTSPQVSKTLKAAGYRRKRRGKKASAGAAAPTAAKHGLNLDALIAAKALIQNVGSVKAAQEALAAMKKLA